MQLVATELASGLRRPLADLQRLRVDEPRCGARFRARSHVLQLHAILQKASARHSSDCVGTTWRRECLYSFVDWDVHSHRLRDGLHSATAVRPKRAVRVRPSRVDLRTVRVAAREVLGSASRELVIHSDRAKPISDGSIVALGCRRHALTHAVTAVESWELPLARDCRSLVISRVVRGRVARQTIVSTGPVRMKVRQERSACGPPEDSTDHHGVGLSA